MGVTEIALEVQRDLPVCPRFKPRVVGTVQTNTRFYDPATSRKLRLRYISSTSETSWGALPLYSGAKPRQVISFQWSDHVFNIDGDLTHRKFLHAIDPISDDYSPSNFSTYAGAKAPAMELSKQDGLANSAAISRLGQALAQVRKRTVDLRPLIEDHVYDADFRGLSLSSLVLPSFVPRLWI